MARANIDHMATVLNREPRKLEFARRLRALMDSKGIGPSELARQAKALLPAGNKFQAANVRQYIGGLSIPKAEYLEALCSALGVSATDVVPVDTNNSSRRRVAPWSVALSAGVADISVGHVHQLTARDLGDGRLWLSFSESVSWDTALKVLALLRPSHEGDTIVDKAESSEIA